MMEVAACRVCLQPAAVSLESSRTFGDTSHTVQQLLQMYTRVRFTEPWLPQHMCNGCVLHLDNSHKFSERYIRTHAELMQGFKNLQPKRTSHPVVSRVYLLTENPKEIKILPKTEIVLNSYAIVSKNASNLTPTIILQPLDKVKKAATNVTPMCTVCSKQFLTHETLRKHLKGHPYCFVCEKMFDSPSSLVTHNVDYHFSRMRTCAICDKTFSSVKLLEQHRLAHAELDSNVLERGGAVKERTEDVEIEMELEVKAGQGLEFDYVEEKPKFGLTRRKVQCKLCGSLFKNHTCYLQHRASCHKSNVCRRCNRGWTSRAALLEHARAHGAYDCARCMRAYASRAALHTHYRRHHNVMSIPYFCGLCDDTTLSYEHLPDLLDHLKTHSNNHIVEPKSHPNTEPKGINSLLEADIQDDVGRSEGVEAAVEKTNEKVETADGRETDYIDDITLKITDLNDYSGSYEGAEDINIEGPLKEFAVNIDEAVQFLDLEDLQNKSYVLKVEDYIGRGDTFLIREDLEDEIEELRLIDDLTAQQNQPNLEEETNQEIESLVYPAQELLQDADELKNSVKLTEITEELTENLSFAENAEPERSAEIVDVSEHVKETGQRNAVPDHSAEIVDVSEHVKETGQRNAVPDHTAEIVDVPEHVVDVSKETGQRDTEELTENEENNNIELFQCEESIVEEAPVEAASETTDHDTATVHYYVVDDDNGENLVEITAEQAQSLVNGETLEARSDDKQEGTQTDRGRRETADSDGESGGWEAEGGSEAGAAHACRLCQAVLTRRYNLLRHLAVAHGRYTLRCGGCGVRFNKPALYEVHKMSCRSPDRLLQEKEDSSKQRRPVCPVCDEKFKKRQMMLEHLETVHSEQCSVDLVNQHYFCKICKKTLSTRPGFSYHMRTHGGFPRHACPLCARRFTVRAALRNHIAGQHTHLRPHLCQQCGRRFVSSDHLRKHLQLTHGGRRDFLCMQCGLTFQQSSHVRQHQWVHSGVKPHACQYCQGRFSSKGALKKHMSQLHNAEWSRDRDRLEQDYRRRERLQLHNNH